MGAGDKKVDSPLAPAPVGVVGIAAAVAAIDIIGKFEKGKKAARPLC